MRRAPHAAALQATIASLLLAACGGEGEEKSAARADEAPEKASSPQEKKPPAAPGSDAGPPADAAAPAAPAIPAPPALGAGEDLDGFHLDPGNVEYEVPAPEPVPEHEPRPIEIVLRSTPPGARAAVDGVPVGRTPTLWRGTADGEPHEFTFVLPGYAMARYRFTPTQGGVVHGTLKKIAVEQPDAGPAP